MCPLGMDVQTLESAGTIFEIEESDIMSILESRPRPINIERNRSFELDHLDQGLSPHARRSGFNTPARSLTYFETHALVAEAWENIRRSIVYFRRQPVGTIAALDHSVEELNYDQV